MCHGVLDLSADSLGSGAYSCRQGNTGRAVLVELDIDFSIGLCTEYILECVEDMLLASSYSTVNKEHYTITKEFVECFNARASIRLDQPSDA